MKKIFAVILIALALQACAPVAFIAGATTGGTMVNDRRSMKTMLQDRDITYKTNVALYNDKTLSQGAHINIATFNHIVLLTGQVPTPALRAKAVALVKQTPGIRRIYNEIAIGGPTASAVRSNDAWLTTKVKAKLLTAEGLKSAQLKVLTENSVVYLMGITSRKQGTAAANAARQVSGVRKVVKLFEYVR